MQYIIISVYFSSCTFSNLVILPTCKIPVINTQRAILQHKSYTSKFKNSGYKVKVNVNIPPPLNPSEVTVEIMMKTGIFELLIAQKSMCALGLCITL